MSMKLVKGLCIGLILALVVTVSGCAGMTPTQQRALSGGAIGSVAGLGIAALAGGPLIAGAAAGAAAGAIGGVIVDQCAH
jgi:osmotically inducible lipoprotein OsmB